MPSDPSEPTAMTTHDTPALYDDPAGLDELTSLSDEVIETVRRWLAESAEVKADPSAERLAGVLKDPRGLEFTVGFVDGVIRPEDASVAAHNFAVLAKDVPKFLPWHLRVATRMGAVAGRLVPSLVIPIVRRVLRGMVGHLIVDAHRIPGPGDPGLAIRVQGKR